MDDPAVARQVPAVEFPIPEVGRVVAGELAQEADYRVLRSRGTPDWLLLHTVSGAGLVHGADGSRLRTVPGQAVLLRPGTLQDYGTDPATGTWRLLYAHVHPPATWLALLDWPEDSPGLGTITLGADVDTRVQKALRSAARATRLAVGRPELFALNGLEAALLWYDSQNPRRHRLDERVLRVLEHIDAHLDEELDVPRLARLAHLSPSRLAHLFAAQVGTSVRGYVEAQRLELAARLLEMTPDPVAEIARRVGYQDPLYFSRRFRAAHGQSPSAHRARHRVV
ncbi:helix-turn-helix domain-containing protein [Brachybacterium sp. J153]|uniref:helix-turn-helix domain-containing protein n=1 Tax=Brachybacterium sp. J153 TaxID=3116488 RepID=UPI002E78F617|nr:helix-turn-helix domain-containing protein [Brachybacterium sp. J153]MEE1617732.1 helix-turn-helix domain-containing protein [Brachybacterium sp. J153]